MREPVLVSPSKTARRREPSVNFSSSSRPAPARSCFRYSRDIWFFKIRTGALTLRPVTVVSLSLAFRTACL